MSKLYELRFLDNGVHLKILTMQAVVLKGNILNGLQRKKITGLDMDMVEKLIANPKTEDIIAPPQQEILIDETADITVDKEKMNAYIQFHQPDGGRLLNITEIIEVLKDAQVTFGLHKEVLKSLNDNMDKVYDSNINIATGVKPVPGIDAMMDIKFPVVRNKAPAILEDGNVDYKQVNRPNIVHKGDVLAVITPHTEGTDGNNVLGEVLKATSGKPRTIPNGKGTTLSDDNLTLFSDFDGYVEILDGRITVLREMNIKGDVGTSTGHIDFPGDVNIEGNVVKGFNVKAGGSIKVGGCIEASEITAGSDIVIKQGIKGVTPPTRKGDIIKPGSCIVTARGSITAKFIENATVKAAGFVHADSILFSEVSSNDYVKVQGKIGNIQGGRITALNYIACTSIGAATGVSVIKTRLNVGVTPDMRSHYVDLRQNITEIQKKLAQNQELYKELPETDSTPRQAQRREKLTKAIEEIQETLYPMLKDMKIIRDAMKVSNVGEIRIKKTMNPIVKVSIGQVAQEIDEKFEFLALHSRDGVITIDTYPTEI